MLMLDESSVARLLRMVDLIPAMEKALSDLSCGRAVQPVRTVLPIAEHSGFFGLMPAYDVALGAKLVTFYPENRGVPTHHAMVLLFKPETGEPLAVMDGRLITEMRTGAASAVVTRALARPESAVLGILGSGVQARSHLEALRLVCTFREVRVYSPKGARAFAEEFGVICAASSEGAVRGADVVVVATSSKKPVLSGAWIEPGCHVNAVGACRPDWRELDDDLLSKAKVFVDSREAACRESGDVIASGGKVVEVGEVISGAAPGRISKEEITLFKSVGVAVEDLIAADLVFRKARQASSG